MIKAKWLQHAIMYSLCLFAFMQPFPYTWVSLSAGLMGLLWLLQTNFRLSFNNLKKRKTLWFWMIFFVLHILGYFYSTDKAEASWDLSSKLCFFLLPIILGAGMNVSEKQLEKIFLFFVAGVTCAAMYCIGQAMVIYYHNHTVSQFFYNDLIQGLDANAVAVSWYTIFVLILLLFNKWQYYLKNNKVAIILLTIVHILFLVLLSSKMLIVFFFFILAPLFIYKMYWKQKISIPATLFTIGCFLCLFFLVFFTDNPVKKRFTDITDNSAKFGWHYNLTDTNLKFNNLTLRIFIWKQGIKNIKDHDLLWYGAGIGDIHKLQNKAISDAGVKNIYSEQYRSGLYNINLHNMYIETLMMLGLPGLICLLIILITPFFYAYRLQSAPAYILFFVVSMLFMMQESALQSQDGRIFYSFFNILFWSVYYTKREEEKKAITA